MRILYLQESLSAAGHAALKGRKLFDEFKDISEELLLSYIVLNDEKAKGWDSSLRNDILSESQLNRFQPDIIYVEGSIFTRNGNDWRWRIPRATVEDFVSKGSILIISEVNRNILQYQKSLYRESEDLLGFNAKYTVPDLGVHDSTSNVYGIDQISKWENPQNIICHPSKMIISEWIRPIYKNISNIVVIQPSLLHFTQETVASGNYDTTAILHLDRWVQNPDCCPFASAKKIGNGYVIAIAGHVCGDRITEYFPDNIKWLKNLTTFFFEHSKEDKERKKSRFNSPNKVFLSHKSIDKDKVKKIAKEMAKRGIDFWLDEEQIQLSDSLVESINKGLSEMTHFAIFWSKECSDAPWVKRELNAAIKMLIDHNIPIFIIKLDKTELPIIISDFRYVDAINMSCELVGSNIADAIENLKKRG